MHVLIATDNPGLGLLLRTRVESAGHGATIVEDGESAWASIATVSPDVVISDWKMPGMSGLDLCQKIRRHDEAQYVYFILLTGAERRTNLVRAIDAGVDDYLAKPLDTLELDVRLKVAQRITGLHRMLTAQRLEMEARNERLFEAGRRDPLTKLWNRRQLDEDLDRFRQVGLGEGRVFCLAMADVDAFKRFNDRYGHLAGDGVLRRVADTLKQAVRSSDRVYRYGGEEFLILLPELSLADGARVMERLRAMVEDLAMPHPGAGPIDVLTISVGIVEVNLDASPHPALWLTRADEALYEAKSSGRNKVTTMTMGGGTKDVSAVLEEAASDALGDTAPGASDASHTSSNEKTDGGADGASDDTPDDV